MVSGDPMKVCTVGENQQFKSIQEAMDAMTAEGHNASNPVSVFLVSPGVYSDHHGWTCDTEPRSWKSRDRTYRTSRGRAQGLVYFSGLMWHVIAWPTGHMKRRITAVTATFREAISEAEWLIEMIVKP